MKALLKKAQPPPLKIRVGAGFLLMLALVYALESSGLLAVILPSVIVHELGHIFALGRFGAHPTRLTADVAGFSLDYMGELNHLQATATAAAGPVFGLVLAAAAARLGGHFESEYLLLWGGFGFILNIFNLLPIAPLDGGRIVYHLLALVMKEDVAARISNVLAWVFLALFLAVGAALGIGVAVGLVGIWLILLRCRTCKWRKSMT